MSPSNSSPPVGSEIQTQAPPSKFPYKGMFPAVLSIVSVSIDSPGTS